MESSTGPPRPAPGARGVPEEAATVGDGTAPVDPAAEGVPDATTKEDGRRAAQARLEEATRALGGRVPLPLPEARDWSERPLPEIDRDALLAERAESQAELVAARATLGLAHLPPVEAVVEAVLEAPAGESSAPEEPEFDPEPLRQAAAAVAAASVVSEFEAEPAGFPDEDDKSLQAAEEALAEAQAARDGVELARRRTVGGLISGTGMSIVIAALGWAPWWYVVPIALITILTADLRVSGTTARETSIRAARELGAIGVAGPEGLARIRGLRQEQEATRATVDPPGDARRDALLRWAELAPGEDPAEVEALIERRAGEIRAAQEARAAAQAQAPAEPAPPAAPTPAPDLPEKVRKLAERLAQEAEQTITQVDEQLAELDRIEFARRSLDWHEARAALDAA